MARESKYSIEPQRVVFRETFNSEQDIRRRGGVLSGTVSLGNGTAIFTTDAKINYSNVYRGVKTVRMVVDLDTITEDIIKLTSSHSITVSSGTVSATGFSSPTIYVNGIATSTIGTGKSEIVITTTTAIEVDDLIIGYVSGYLEGKLDLVSFYNYPFIIEEVLNIYSGKRFRALVSSDKVLDIASDTGSIVSQHDIVYYTDWFLPSKDELAAMYTNLKDEGVGDFTTAIYCSSSEASSVSEWVLNFNDNNSFIGNKLNSYYVRACRSFTAGLGAYALRDTGPAGGLIFYIDGGTTYYEAAPSDQSTGKAWSNVVDVLIGTTGTAIGTGQANTTAIIAQSGGTSDWFLPSINGYQAMQDNLNSFGLGSFDNTVGVLYHSSSEYSATYNYKFSFSDNSQYVYNKDVLNNVRACRVFTAVGGAYSLRDTGPAGGLIFYIDGGTTYYEAAPSDQSTGKAWSNVVDVLIGTTDTIIGEGQNNTNEIIAQGGHTDSSAKLCDDYDNTYLIHTDSSAKLCDELIILAEITIVVNEVTIFKDGEVLAMIFNGATSYIINYIISQVSQNTAGTFVAWIRTKDNSVTQEIISFGDTDVDSRLQFDITGAGLIRGLVVKAESPSVEYWAVQTNNTVIKNGVWTHVALVQNGTEPVLYINGEAVAQTFTTSTDKTYWFSQMSGLDNGRIGCGNWNSGGNATFFDGLLNDIKIFTSALTAQQVSQIFSSERHLYNV